MQQGMWLIALPVLGALAAVGCLLLIKVTRRRQATRSGESSEVVPANPMSREQAKTITRRYVAVAVVVTIGVLGLLLWSL